MNNKKKSASDDSLISRRSMLHYGLAGMASVGMASIVGGFLPGSALGGTNLMSSAKTGKKDRTMVTKIIGFDIGNRDIETKMILDLHQEGISTLHYYFWLIEQDSRLGLIDTGFHPEVARKRGVRDIQSPVEALKNIGISPEQIQFVVVSHLHWDHFGAAALFPNATFYIQKKDIDFFTGSYGENPRVAMFCSNITDVQLLSRDGRLKIIDGATEIAPGIGTVWLGGHSPGSQAVTVKSEKGTFLFAVDDSFFFENYEKKLPTLLNFDLPESIDAFQTFDAIKRSSDQVFFIPGHDPALVKKYPGLKLL